MRLYPKKDFEEYLAIFSSEFPEIQLDSLTDKTSAEVLQMIHKIGTSHSFEKWKRLEYNVGFGFRPTISFAVSLSDYVGQVHLYNINITDTLNLEEVENTLNKLSLFSISFSNCSFAESPILNSNEIHPLFINCEFKQKYFIFGNLKFPYGRFAPEIPGSEIQKNHYSAKFDQSFDSQEHIDVGQKRGIPLYQHFSQFIFENCELDINIRISNALSVTMNNVYIEPGSNVIIGPSIKSFEINNIDGEEIIIESVGDIRISGKNNTINELVICGDGLNDIEIQNIDIDSFLLVSEKVNHFLNIINCNFMKAPNLLKLKELPINFSFEGCSFKDRTSKNSETLYRELRIMCQKRASENYTQIFSSLELESRFNIFLKKRSIFDNQYGIEKISSWFLKDFYGYGRNLMQGFLFMLLWTIIFPMILYWNVQDVSGSSVICHDYEETMGWIYEVCKPGNERLPPFFYAIKYILGPIGAFIKTDVFYLASPWLKIIEGFQFLFSTLMWFLLINAARKRFKL